MIIMLNGTFGVGKTTTAAALHQRIPQAIIFDPEPIGIFARTLTDGVRTAGKDTDDFQDITLWRVLFIATATSLYEQYRRPLIIPMTLVHPLYLSTIRTALSKLAPVHHLCLQAPLPVIRERLLKRGDDVEEWAWRKSQQYVPQLNHARYSQHIQTENRDTETIVDDILSAIAT